MSHGASRSREGKISDRRIKLALQVLRREPDLRVRQLARMVRLSVSRLQHLFKEQVGMNLTAYKREFRFAYACTLLRTTFWSLKEIRSEVGIRDASNFVRDFKRYKGMTPSAYRKRRNSRFDQQIAVLTNKKKLLPSGRMTSTIQTR